MANREVNLTKRVKTGQGLRYCPVVLSAKRPCEARRRDRRRARRAAHRRRLLRRMVRGRPAAPTVRGQERRDAAAAQAAKEAELNARNHGVVIVTEGQNGLPISRRGCRRFSRETKLTKKPRPTQRIRRR